MTPANKKTSPSSRRPYIVTATVLLVYSPARGVESGQNVSHTSGFFCDLRASPPGLRNLCPEKFASRKLQLCLERLSTYTETRSTMDRASNLPFVCFCLFDACFFLGWSWNNSALSLCVLTRELGVSELNNGWKDQLFVQAIICDHDDWRW